MIDTSLNYKVHEEEEERTVQGAKAGERDYDREE